MANKFQVWYCYSFNDFAKELCRVFDLVLPEKVQKLFSVKRGEKRITEYIIDFHAIEAVSLWNEEALTDAFFQGLNENIKDELATNEYPESLKSLEDLATRVDLRLFERNHQKGNKVERAVQPWG